MASQFDFVMTELEALGSDRTKKNYVSRGVREPLFGVATGAMKKIMKETGKNQELAEELYATGNYDAMYFAGMIAEPDKMSAADFNRWMEGAYTGMIADYIVAVTLAESPIAQEVACIWIDDERELYQTAGWSCFEWLLGYLPDSSFDESAIEALLEKAVKSIHDKPDAVKYAMNNFVTAAGISFLPLHHKALSAAEAIGDVEVTKKGAACLAPSAADAIQKAADKGKLGFKRKGVRC